jgi:hypothetical protein
MSRHPGEQGDILGFIQNEIIQSLRDNGFKHDRSVYQNDGTFMFRKFGKIMIMVSIYRGHFVVSKCWNTANNGYKVEEYAHGSTFQAFLAKVKEWEISL